MEQLRAAQEDAAVARDAAPAFQFIGREYRWLQQTYPNQYIAVQGERVVAAEPQLDAILIAVRDLPESQVIIEFIPPSGSALVV